ncbi:hypothetical protein Hamer_G023941 [Homarus americanus]|uniref:Uncharacterized protein n=1 Tax=Homarus americanus TaxID=6706 RepID=A0A8J5N5V0_HOMAM|nr:hypothetical protein Hamer_G023941 [Homarus americanus]
MIKSSSFPPSIHPRSVASAGAPLFHVMVGRGTGREGGRARLTVGPAPLITAPCQCEETQRASVSSAVVESSAAPPQPAPPPSSRWPVSCRRHDPRWCLLAGAAAGRRRLMIK